MSGRGGRDRGRLYSLQEIDGAACRPAEKFKFALEDVVLLLLYADPNPIEGKARLMKEVFLALNDVFAPGEAERVSFRPHRLGPYTERVYAAADRLAFTSKVRIAAGGGRGGRSIAITPRGRARIGARFEALPASTRERLVRKRLEWDALAPAGLRGYVRARHGEYLDGALPRGGPRRGGPAAGQEEGEPRRRRPAASRP